MLKQILEVKLKCMPIFKKKIVLTWGDRLILHKPLGTMHPIYGTDVPLLPTVRFLYIQSINIFNYFFRLSLTIFVYSSTKYCVFTNFFGS